jgi:hypothetical protein
MTSSGPPAEVLVLRPSRARAVVRFLFWLAVTVGYVWILVLAPDCFLMWALAVACGLLGLAALRRVFDYTSCLRLTTRGFIVFDRGQAMEFTWNDIRKFRPGPHGRMVVFDYALPAARPSAARKVAQFVAGGDGALPDTYGLTARELAELLNEWRERFATPAPPPAS